MFFRQGHMYTYAYERGVSRLLATEESPMPPDAHAYYPAGAFYDDTTLVIGGANGALQLIRPTSLCLLPQDTVGGGGGCARSFGGSCPDPYRATPRCICAPGYVGVHCDVCDEGFGRTDGGLCTVCSDGTFGSNRSISKACVPCSAAEVASTGSKSCRLCEGGTIPSDDQSRCALCGVGKHVSASRTACVDCSKAEVASVGSESCTVCNNGTIPSFDQSRCTLCGVGTRRSASRTRCDKCPPNEVRFAF